MCLVLQSLLNYTLNTLKLLFFHLELDTCYFTSGRHYNIPWGTEAVPSQMVSLNFMIIILSQPMIMTIYNSKLWYTVHYSQNDSSTISGKKHSFLLSPFYPVKKRSLRACDMSQILKCFYYTIILLSISVLHIQFLDCTSKVDLLY